MIFLFSYQLSIKSVNNFDGMQGVCYITSLLSAAPNVKCLFILYKKVNMYSCNLP